GPPSRMPDGGQSRGAASAITVTQDDDLVPTRRDLRGVNGCVVGFRAAVGEEGFLQTTGRDLVKLLGQFALRLVGVERRGVRERLDLFDDRLVHLRVRVPDTHGQHAAEAIEIAIALVVPHVLSLAAHERERLLVIGSDRREEKLFMLADDLGLRGLRFDCAHHCILMLKRLDGSSVHQSLPSFLIIDLASCSLISLWRGTGCDCLVCGLVYQSWRLPCRTNTQPMLVSCLIKSRRFIRLLPSLRLS